MNIMKIILFPLFLVSCFSYAGMNTPGTTAPAVPKNLHIVNSQGNTYVQLPVTGCSTSVYFLNPSHNKYDAIFSVLLTAQTSGKKVSVRFDKCVNGTSNPFGNIVGVYFKG